MGMMGEAEVGTSEREARESMFCVSGGTATSFIHPLPWRDSARLGRQIDGQFILSPEMVSAVWNREGEL